MIRRLFNSQTHSITGAAIIIGAASFVSRIIGMLRDRLFAHYFGAGDIMDAYYAAFKIPDLVYNLLVVGALSAGFIPVFVELWQTDKKQAWRVTSAIINILGIVLIIMCTTLIYFTPEIVHILVPGFEGEKRDMTIMLTRVMFASPILLGISSVIGGVLQSFKAFFVYSLTPILYNIGIIIGVIFFYPMWGIKGLALGVVLGALLHLLIQLPSFFHYGFRYKPLLLLKDKSVRVIAKLMLPRTLGMATKQINILAITMIASGLASGSIAIFSFADNLQSVPSGIVGISFGIAIFPTLAQLAAQKNINTMGKRIAETTQQILFLIIPLTIIFLLLRAQIVRIVLGTGEFNWEDTVLTAHALAFFSISLFAQALIPMLARSFFALKNTWTPFFIGLFCAIVNVSTAFYIAPYYHIVGVIATYSCSMILQVLLLWIFLRRQLKTLHEYNITITLLKISIAAFLMAISIQFLKYPLATMADMQTFIGVLIQATISATIGLLIYGITCHQLKLKEMRYFQHSMKRRWLKMRGIQESSDHTIT